MAVLLLAESAVLDGGSDSTRRGAVDLRFISFLEVAAAAVKGDDPMGVMRDDETGAGAVNERVLSSVRAESERSLMLSTSSSSGSGSRRGDAGGLMLGAGTDDAMGELRDSDDWMADEAANEHEGNVATLEPMICGDAATVVVAVVVTVTVVVAPWSSASSVLSDDTELMLSSSQLRSEALFSEVSLSSSSDSMRNERAGRSRGRSRCSIDAASHRIASSP